MLHRNVSGPCTIPGVSPLFHQGQRSGDVVVPQGRALVNSKPYPVCLFFWRGRPSTDAPGGTNINIAAAAERTSPTSPCRRPHQQESRRATALAWLAATLHRKLCRRPRTRRGDCHSRPRRTNRHIFGRYALVDCRIEELRRTKRPLRHHTPARERLGGEARAFRRTVYTVSEVIALRGSHEFRCIRHVEDDGISLCPCQAVKSGAPPHQLNRRRYGAGTLSLAFQGCGVRSRTPETYQVCSHPTAFQSTVAPSAD